MRLKLVLVTPILLGATLTLAGCGTSPEDEKDTSSVTDVKPSPNQSISSNPAKELTPEEQAAQNEILSSKEDVLGSNDKPLTPNGYADLSTEPTVLMGDVKVKLGDTVLLTLKVKEPGTLEIFSFQKSEIKNEGLASIAIPMNKSGEFDITFTPKGSNPVKIGKVIVK